MVAEVKKLIERPTVNNINMILTRHLCCSFIVKQLGCCIKIWFQLRLFKRQRCNLILKFLQFRISDFNNTFLCFKLFRCFTIKSLYTLKVFKMNIELTLFCFEFSSFLIKSLDSIRNLFYLFLSNFFDLCRFCFDLLTQILKY